MVKPDGTRCLSVIAGIATSSGGPTYSVASLCEATARAGVLSSLITVASSKGEREHVPDANLVTLIRVRGFHSERLRLSWCPGFTRALHEHCTRIWVGIIHNHGLWTQANYAAASVARGLKLPLVVSPHGMLEPWAMRHKAWKKRPVWWAWQRKALGSAAVLRATAPKEIDSFRRLGLTNPVALIPNGLDIPDVVHGAGLPKPVRVALFLSRIHPVKGLLNLVKAWSKARPVGWRVIVCGPDEEKHLGEVQAAVAETGLGKVFEFRPPAYGQEKEALFAAADLFVLPTFTESFGIVIAEALAAGVPVVTTKGAPWEALNTHLCGWWVDIGVEPLAAALREACALPDEERKTMGLRGRALVAEKFSWERIGNDMKAVYEWVLCKGPAPACIIENCQRQQ